MSERPAIQVEVTSTFRRNLRSLVKKYRSIQSDVKLVVEQLEQGELPGDQVPEIGYEVFKVRVRNRDIQKGKRGGYRLIYYVKTTDRILLLTIYPKSAQANLSADEIKSIIAESEQT